MKPVRLFISYSHKDEDLRKEFDAHLMALVRAGSVEGWYDRRIRPGREWDQEIRQELQRADIVLFLVSSDFIASEYIYDYEINPALQRQATGKAVAIPVILRPVAWQHLPLGKLQALPFDARPIVTWASRDEAWLSVIKGISEAIIELRLKLKGHAARTKFYEVMKQVEQERAELESYTNEVLAGRKDPINLNPA